MGKQADVWDEPKTPPEKRGAIRVHKCSTMASFLDLYTKRYLRSKALVFRGHANANWRLESSLRRLMRNEFKENGQGVHAAEEYFAPAFMEFLEHMYAHGSSTVRAQIDEYVAVRRGLPTPEQHFRSSQIRQRLIEGFSHVEPEVWMRQEALVRTESKLLALAQHYGLPTPLIDWTKSPFVAWFFALADEHEIPNNPTVVAVAPSILATHISRFIDAQTEKGRNYALNRAQELNQKSEGVVGPEFVVDHLDYTHLVEVGRFSTVDGFLPDNERLLAQSGLLTNQSVRYSLEHTAETVWTGGEPLIIKFVLTKQTPDEALQILRRMNVHAGTLFPGPIGAARLGLDAITVKGYTGLLGYGSPIPGFG